MDPIIEQLAAARRLSGSSQRTFASMLETSQSVICAAESGRGTPRFATVRRWADALGYDLVLVKREDG
jgi:transcriptional regulator with XRE-family HTH domain